MLTVPVFEGTGHEEHFYFVYSVSKDVPVVPWGGPGRDHGGGKDKELLSQNWGDLVCVQCLKGAGKKNREF